VLDQRGRPLMAAVGFVGCAMPSYERALWALRTWLDSWPGVSTSLWGCTAGATTSSFRSTTTAAGARLLHDRHRNDASQVHHTAEDSACDDKVGRGEKPRRPRQTEAEIGEWIEKGEVRSYNDRGPIPGNAFGAFDLDTHQRAE